MSDYTKSDYSNPAPQDARSRFGGTALALALLSAAGVMTTGELAAQGGGLQPSWIHRGARVLFNIGSNTTTAVSNSTLNTSTTAGSPGSCAANSGVMAANGGLQSFSDPSGASVQEKVDCTQTYYVTTVTVTGANSYTETYYSFQTVPISPATPASPAHGHAIYFPANGNGAASLLFEPD